MGVLARTWLGLAALGAGLVHLGAAAGAPLPALVPLTVLGGAEVVWGVAVLGRARVLVPGIALVGALAGPVAWAGALALGGGSLALPAATLAGASALDLVVAAGLAVRLRFPSRGRALPSTAAYLLNLVAGAAVVAAVTTASLGASPLGAGAMSGMHM